MVQTRNMLPFFGKQGPPDEYNENDADDGVISWKRETSPAKNASREVSLLLSDICEKGYCREQCTGLLTPPDEQVKLSISQDPSSGDYNLFLEGDKKNGDEFLLYAKHCEPTGAYGDRGAYQIYLYPRDHGCFDEKKSVFTLKYEYDVSRWKLEQDCGQYRYAKRSLAEFGEGGDQFLLNRLVDIDHYQEVVGDGIFNAMDVRIVDTGEKSEYVKSLADPAVDVRRSTRRRANSGCSNESTPGINSWGRATGASLSESLEPDDPDVICLTTKKPRWNPQLNSLVLRFKGRHIKPSSRNFQVMVANDTEQRVVCQFGRLHENFFALDVVKPVSVVQAFALAISSHYWT